MSLNSKLIEEHYPAAHPTATQIAIGDLTTMSESGDSVIVSESESIEAVIITRDDVSDFNPENILPQKPEWIQKIRAWLEPTSYDVAGGEYRKHSDSHVKGTGGWLTASETYKQWLESREDGLLWLKGIPGSGKSVMAANLIRELGESNPGSPVLFFFFRQIIKANHQPAALLRDWMEQILDYSPPLQLALREAIENRSPSVDSVSMEDLWKYLKLAIAGIQGKVFCVGDALDEMDTGNDAFLKALGEFGQWRPEKVKVLITSRPVPSVEGPLRRTPCLQLRLQEDLVDTDISTFVRDALSKSSIPQGDWQTIVNAVPGRANGLFLYAKLAMDAFLEPGADVNDVLLRLPLDLNALYTGLLSEHAARSKIAPEIQDLILRSVTHAARPLRLLELAELVKGTKLDGVERNMKETKALIRAACGPLLEILPDETVSVIHHSFTEYLKGSTRQDDGTGYQILKPGPTHGQLAIYCLRYLQAGCLDEINLDEDADNINDAHDRDEYSFNKKEVPGRLVQLRLKHPFLNYATSNWVYHVNKSEAAGHDQTDVDLELERVLGNSKYLQVLIHMKWTTSEKGYVEQVHVAAKAGLQSYLKKILEKSDLKALDTSGNRTPLWWAADAGHAATIQILIDAGANPDQDESSAGLKPLHEAARQNHHQAVKIMLEAGVDPLTPKTCENPGRSCGNAPRTTGHTPLMYACQNGHTETVDVFLPFLKDIDIVHKALCWAAARGQSQVVARILEHPCVQVDAKVAGDTALFKACSTRDLKTISILLKAGAKPSTDCDDDDDEFAGIGRGRYYLVGEKRPVKNALHALCFARNLGNEAHAEDLQKIFELLHDAGVNIHQTTTNGQTALFGAVASPILTKLLLEAGADANFRDQSESTPLHQVQNPETVSLLIELGKANINAANKRGCTPLLTMLSSYHTETILKLLEYGPNCNAVDNEGNGVLHIALKQWSSNSNIIAALIKAGANPNLPNRDGLAPILALGRNSRDTDTILDLLLANGADINVRDRTGETLFFYTVANMPYTFDAESHKDLKEMISRGASFEARDFLGRTVLHKAIKHHDFSGHRIVKEGGLSRLDFLRSLDLDIQAVDYQGNSLLHELALLNNNHSSYASDKVVALWKMLIDLGLNVEQQNYAGRTPLHTLCEQNTGGQYVAPGNTIAIDYVLTKVKNLDIADHDGITPLHLAIVGGEFYTKKLLDAGANPSAVTHEGLTPLHIAARCRESNSVGLLLDSLALQNGLSTTQYKEPAIKEHSESNSENVVIPGVNAKIYDDGRSYRSQFKETTPLHYACRSGWPETVALLIDAGADLKDEESLHFTSWHELEVENALWQVAQETEVGTGQPVALKVKSTSRPARGSSGTNYRDWHNLTQSEASRLEEIGEMLRLNDVKPPEPTQNGWQFGNRHPVVDKFSDRLREEGKRFSLEMLREDGYVKPEDSHSDLFFHFMKKKEYDQVVELATLGADFLQKPHGHGNSNFSCLVRHGFAKLAERVALAIAERKKGSVDGPLDYTFLFNQELQPSSRHEDPPTLFLLDAVRRSSPNMEMVKLFVEKFGAGLNGMDKRSQYTDGGSKLMPYETALMYVSRGLCWWHVHQALPYLIKAGADLNQTNWKGQTALHIALQGDGNYPGLYNKEVVQKLILAGADLNAGGEDSILAAAKHHADLLDLLVKNGATVTTHAILAVIDVPNADGLDVLLAAEGVDLNARRPKPLEEDLPAAHPLWDVRLPSHEEYPLYIAGLKLDSPVAAKRKTPEDVEVIRRMVKALLNNGADPFAKFSAVSYQPHVEPHLQVPTTEVADGCVEKTILHELILGDNAVDIFLDTIPNLDVDHRNAEGQSLLHAACATGPDDVHRTPKHESVDEVSEVSIAQRLLGMGADLRARDLYGRNMLHYMVGVDGRGPDFVRFRKFFNYILEKAPDMLAEVDHDGMTPLFYGMKRTTTRTRSEVAHCLVEGGANILAVNNAGDSVLHTLATSLAPKEALELFEVLVKKGVDINGRNKRGESPLFIFCNRPKGDPRSHSSYYDFDSKSESDDDQDEFKKYPECQAYFMMERLGADFFATDARGRGLLQVAAGGPAELFKKLMEKGLDPMLEDEAQQTAIDVAAACANTDILELFEKK